VLPAAAEDVLRADLPALITAEEVKTLEVRAGHLSADLTKITLVQPVLRLSSAFACS
jgi:hypothetical protein